VTVTSIAPILSTVEYQVNINKVSGKKVVVNKLNQCRLSLRPSLSN
jgi:hypothetical protein